MSDSITYSRLAVRLLNDLMESAEGHTTDEPLEMVQLGLVLKAFDDVSDLTENRLRSETKSEHKSKHPDSSPEDAGTIG